jgi:hypothetical protein
MAAPAKNESERAADALTSLRERRERGETIKPEEQEHAEKVAIHEAETLASGGVHGHGPNITAIVASLQNHITIIEAARARGYLKAVGDLSAKGLDKTADYDAFGTSLAGNLLWALSGVIPGAPLGEMAIGGLSKFFKAAWHLPSPAQTAVVGTVGAMMAQFSGGVPSSTSSSDKKIALETTLTQANSVACNALRRAVPEDIARAVGEAPPTRDTDATKYESELELGMRHLLYGDVYEKKLNDGELPDAAKIEEDARDQLLRQYVVANAALDDGKVVSTKAAKDTTEVDAAVGLMGGQEKLALQPYELVLNQLRVATKEMGCEIDLDEKKIARDLSTPPFVFQVQPKSFSKYALFRYSGVGSLSKWSELFQRKIIKVTPEFDGEFYLPGLEGMDRVSILKQDLDSTQMGGQTVYSASRILFSVRGAGEKVDYTWGKIDIPADFMVLYEVEP